MLWASAAVATVMLTIVAGATLVVYRATFHNWPWEGAPARLKTCHRDYTREGLVSRAAIRRQTGFQNLYPIFRAEPLLGHEVYSVMSPAKRVQLRKQGGPEAPCAGLWIYMEESPGKYREYVLSGGP